MIGWFDAIWCGVCLLLVLFIILLVCFRGFVFCGTFCLLLVTCGFIVGCLLLHCLFCYLLHFVLFVALFLFVVTVVLLVYVC